MSVNHGSEVRHPESDFHHQLFILGHLQTLKIVQENFEDQKVETYHKNYRGVFLHWRRLAMLMLVVPSLYYVREYDERRLISRVYSLGCSGPMI